MSEHYECPRCGKRSSLWEGIEVEGWQSIDDQLQPSTKGSPYRDVDWTWVNKTGAAGCAECGWEGLTKNLRHVVLGIDGNPLPEVHPGQTRIEA